MSIQGEFARENTVQAVCHNIKQRLKEFPNSAEGLKALGRDALAMLDFTPDWSDEYRALFRE